MDPYLTPSSFPPRAGEQITDAPAPLKVVARLKDGVNGRTDKVDAWAIAWTRQQILVVWRDEVATRHTWLEPHDVRRA